MKKSNFLKDPTASMKRDFKPRAVQISKSFIPAFSKSSKFMTIKIGLSLFSILAKEFLFGTNVKYAMVYSNNETDNKIRDRHDQTDEKIRDRHDQTNEDIRDRHDQTDEALRKHQGFLKCCCTFLQHWVACVSRKYVPNMVGLYILPACLLSLKGNKVQARGNLTGCTECCSNASLSRTGKRLPVKIRIKSYRRQA